jgi:hypothetical protein
VKLSQKIVYMWLNLWKEVKFMPEDYCGLLLEDFLKNSWESIRVLVGKLRVFKGEKGNRKVTLFHYVNGEKV